VIPEQFDVPGKVVHKKLPGLRVKVFRVVLPVTLIRCGEFGKRQLLKLTPKSKRSFERLAMGIVLSVAAFLFLYQLYLIHKYAVEIPYMDDWTMFGPGRPAKLSVAWLLAG